MSCMPLVFISTGELFDKYTILEIKRDKIQDENKLLSIHQELSHLTPFIDLSDNQTIVLLNEMKEINVRLWEIEDRIRIKEANQEFDAEFIQIARSVYITNDERHVHKNKINSIFKSLVTDIKSYV